MAYLPLIETTMEEVETMISDLLQKQSVSPFIKAYRTKIEIRESFKAKNGRYNEITFVGLSPQETMDLIINHINTKP